MDSTAKGAAGRKAIDTIREKLRPLPADEWILRIIRGDRSALAQAITLVESTLESHRPAAGELLTHALPHSGRSIRIGITGVPGVGKSTFIEAFGHYLIGLGKKVAVLAIDPSSPVSKGSILGDKTRMEKLSMDPHAFIRPSPSAETLGGVARKTRESIVLCEAAGFDVVIIETVGVGQSETTVHGMCDFFLLLMLAGAGDQLQGIKRGIMEMCDGMLITKADGENARAASKARGEYMGALHLFPPRASGWIPRVAECSAIEQTGLSEAWDMIASFERWMKDRGLFAAHRLEQDMDWLRTGLRDRLQEEFFRSASVQAALEKYSEELRHGRITPFQAADEIWKLRH